MIVLLVGHIFHAAINRIEKVEDDYREMRDLKVRAEAADVAKSQVFAVSITTFILKDTEEWDFHLHLARWLHKSVLSNYCHFSCI